MRMHLRLFSWFYSKEENMNAPYLSIGPLNNATHIKKSVGGTRSNNLKSLRVIYFPRFYHGML